MSYQSAQIRTVDWATFNQQFAWKQGDHLSIVGPTNSGKSTLLFSLLNRRKYVTVLATKPEDDTLARFIKKERYRTTPIWPPKEHSYHNVLWPKYNSPADKGKQIKVFARALEDMFVDRGWCVVADELWYLSNVLGLDELLQAYWSQGRSIGLTLAGATQRPRHVPLMMYSQATHLFFYKTGDGTDRKRLGEIGSVDTRLVENTIGRLPFRTFLYINAATGDMMISKVQL